MTEPSALYLYRRRSKLNLDRAAAMFGVNRTTFFRWEVGRVPPERCAEVSAKTGIPRWRLRPDLWDEPASSKKRTLQNAS